jgi:hypothetical protein
LPAILLLRTQVESLRIEFLKSCSSLTTNEHVMTIEMALNLLLIFKMNSSDDSCSLWFRINFFSLWLSGLNILCGNDTNTGLKGSAIKSSSSISIKSFSIETVRGAPWTWWQGSDLFQFFIFEIIAIKTIHEIFLDYIEYVSKFWIWNNLLGIIIKFTIWSSSKETEGMSGENFLWPSTK